MTVKGLNKIFAANVKKYRLEAGLTKTALASKAHLSTVTIREIENQYSNIELRTCLQLAQALNVEVFRLYMNDFENKAFERFLKKKPKETLIFAVGTIEGV